MNRPHLEVADIVRAQGEHFIANNRSWIHWAHQKVLRAIANCRTAVLGGHRYQCPSCGHRAIVFHSCRNRHCPKCPGRGSSALGSQLAKKNCSPSATSTSCLPCLTNSVHSYCRTRSSSTICCSGPAPKLFCRLPLTPSISEPRSVFFLCSIPGVKTYDITRTFIA